MRQFLFASHAHFAAGINESLELLAGVRENVRTLSMFVDGNDDVEAAARSALNEIGADDELVICTDLLGGSVNNEFLKVIQGRENVHLVTNMNLPLLLQLLFVDEDVPIDQAIREIVQSDETRVKYVNDLLAMTENDDEEF